MIGGFIGDCGGGISPLYGKVCVFYLAQFFLKKQSRIGVKPLLTGGSTYRGGKRYVKHNTGPLRRSPHLLLGTVHEPPVVVLDLL